MNDGGFYLTWFIYIIGTANIILLLEIQNDWRIYYFDWFI